MGIKFLAAVMMMLLIWLYAFRHAIARGGVEVIAPSRPERYQSVRSTQISPYLQSPP